MTAMDIVLIVLAALQCSGTAIILAIALVLIAGAPNQRTAPKMRINNPPSVPMPHVEIKDTREVNAA